MLIEIVFKFIVSYVVVFQSSFNCETNTYSIYFLNYLSIVSAVPVMGPIYTLYQPLYIPLTHTKRGRFTDIWKNENLVSVSTVYNF